MAKPAVFLDKDGTLIDNVPYNVNPALVRLSKGADEALPLLQAHGFCLVVVSNQAGVARGFFREEALTAVETRLRELFDGVGVSLAGFYYCPHDPKGSVQSYATDCWCRKPQPGMLIRASRELDLDLAGSWLIGDILDDVEAGRRAGCKTVLLLNGSETEWNVSAARLPHYCAANLLEAAQIAVGSSSSQKREQK
ncbi:MAG TPA: HAD family hydrolase [Acidobacteriota bacterium]|nr:HAD family hydrolase [Acidobacteriota bacterium]